MKSTLMITLLVAAALISIGVLRLRSGAEGRSGVFGPVATPDREQVGGPETFSSPATMPAERRVQHEAQVVEADVRVREEPAWLACTRARNPADLRACLERGLPADGLAPSELARWLCGEWRARFPETDPMILAEVVLRRWPRKRFFEGLEYIQGRCSLDPKLDSWWAGFLRLQLERDPTWVAGLRDALDARALFGTEVGTLALATAIQLVATGDAPRLQGLLEDGARGLLGGSDDQVACAMEAAWRQRSGARERLALLASIVASSSFRGRDFETDALIGLVLHDQTLPEGDPGPPLGLARRILSDPVLGPGAAEHLLILADWHRVSTAYTAAERGELVSLAHTVLGSSATTR